MGSPIGGSAASSCSGTRILCPRAAAALAPRGSCGTGEPRAPRS